MRAVLVTLAKDHFKKASGRRVITEGFGNGILFSENPQWKTNRRIVQLLFSKERIANDSLQATEITAGAYKDSVDFFRRGNRREVRHELARTVREFTSRAVLGVDIEPLLTEMANLAGGNAAAILGIVPIDPRFRRFQDAVKQMDALIYSLIDQRSEKCDGEDSLSFLLRTKKEYGHEISNEQIRDEMVTLLFAGGETTAWVFNAMDQELNSGKWAEMLHEELKLTKMLGQRPCPDNLPRATAFVKEVMRLHPPIFIIGREAINDVDIGGVEVSAGDYVLLNLQQLHRHPDFWNDPLEFEPERFLGDRLRLIPKDAYIPFGLGQRMCIGYQLAMDMSVNVAGMVSGFYLK
jgi:cytochrome P450